MKKTTCKVKFEIHVSDDNKYCLKECYGVFKSGILKEEYREHGICCIFNKPLINGERCQDCIDGENKDELSIKI